MYKTITNSPPSTIFHNYRAEFNGGTVESAHGFLLQNTGWNPNTTIKIRLINLGLSVFMFKQG